MFKGKSRDCKKHPCSHFVANCHRLRFCTIELKGDELCDHKSSSLFKEAMLAYTTAADFNSLRAVKVQSDNILSGFHYSTLVLSIFC